MELSKKDRVFLSNQYRILEALYPDEADHWAQAREVMERGYELDYSTFTEQVVDDPLVHSACIEVIDIMDMFCQLRRSYEALDDKPEVNEWVLKFSGFDGNNESDQLAYARYLIDDDRFEELSDAGDRLNSHSATLDRYRRQLAEWKKSPDKYQLTSDDILRIAKAAIHPENR